MHKVRKQQVTHPSFQVIYFKKGEPKTNQSTEYPLYSYLLFSLTRRIRYEFD
jgi:hypothetical protein